MIKELICISCPMGCHLKVDAENNTVTGNTCKRGAEYGINEVTHPVRVITSTVKVKGGQLPVIPVKTNGAIPKGLNFKCMEVLSGVELQAPVKIGDVIVKDVLGTGVDIVAARNMKAI
ncbi:MULTISPECIES: DUF1667 domain-containing protein [Clostridium]|uniref:DUF1667 domain-containing protein n=1 Tax=Clostridium aquiflavi TaxID=3073603 RepID=A0ABU1EF49_9CLOT|nr:MULTISPECIES: DUF1667 domain-containing protein [Clostridium]MBN1064198.1 DUF1667 domain-containing protein [Clostridium botulinum]MBN1070427.1 DUF1667 domain-containing protein [Clostridium botulinum]MDR5586985.1 DUF1667 domain-containing protein [Clostridium sp. 5N-1]NFG60450.1 DUF1667 domain-containing protein [Clostridium botulinum]NFO12686.1 DUF1667 domain-containing protein [Clostridium botulinum]